MPNTKTEHKKQTLAPLDCCIPSTTLLFLYGIHQTAPHPCDKLAQGTKRSMKTKKVEEETNKNNFELVLEIVFAWYLVIEVSQTQIRPINL